MVHKALGHIIPTNSTNHVLLIRPHYFFSNPQTATTNSFQQTFGKASNAKKIHEEAMLEFDNIVKTLNDNGITVSVINGPEGSPDAVFPNNVFSTHSEGITVLYPMNAENRQAELTETLKNYLQHNYQTVKNYRAERDKGERLEGTGSLVLDRLNKVAYAVLSPRTTPKMLEKWGNEMDYSIVPFHALDDAGEDIYHTNVVMFVGTKVAAVCFDAIPNADEKAMVRKNLEENGIEVVDLTQDQLNNFCGNAIEIQTNEKEGVLLMSDTAYEALSQEQKNIFESYYSKIIHVDINTIERHGGGSARCMVAEIYGDRPKIQEKAL
ncbi:MAG: amidinotransferase [Alphaproteobacteria bacterium]|nr:amidinotransferase [Alphaproteobacteria bacterium]